MHRTLIAGLFVAGWSTPAWAGEGFVVWMQAVAPDERAIQRAENLSGVAQHLAHVDLAFPPQPATPEDAARIEALRTAVASGKARWDEFDVELTIAREIEAAVVPVTLIRDKRDLQDLVDARLFQGAAVQKAFSPQDFGTSDDAKPFRTAFPGLMGNGPWLSAIAIDPVREFTRADVADGSAFPDLQALEPAFEGLPLAEVDLSKLPAGATVVVNGLERPSSAPLKLHAGAHYAHILRNGVVAGRQTIKLEPAQKLELPMLVDAIELDQARNQVLQGLTTGFPDDVKSAIEDLGDHYPGPIFVGALDEKGHVSLLPYARGAQLFKQKPVTVVLAGEVGGGIVVSSLFNDADGKNVTAPAMMGHLGMEIGVYNLALLGGGDLALTPANTITYGKTDGSGNATTSMLPRFWGGAGLYVLRPSGTTPTLLLAGTYGYNYPAHQPFGGRVALGIPIDDKGTWFRLALGGDAAPRSRWEGELRDVAMYSMYLRFGLAARL
jgi:hypothetical protein